MDSRLVISENPKVATDEEAERYLIEEYRPGNFFTLERSNPDYQGWPIEGNIGGIAYRGQLLFLVHLFIVDPVVKQAYFSSFCSIEFHRFKGESIPINRDVIPLLDTHPRLADQFWQDLHDRVAIYRNRGEWPSDVHSDRENLGTHLHQQLLELWKASQRELRKIEFKATGYDPADTFSLTLGEDQAGRPHPAEHESEGAAKEKREAGGPQKSTKKKGRPRTAGARHETVRKHFNRPADFKQAIKDTKSGLDQKIVALIDDLDGKGVALPADEKWKKYSSYKDVYSQRDGEAVLDWDDLCQRLRRDRHPA